MGFKSALVSAVAPWIARKEYARHRDAALHQERTLLYLLENGQATAYGRQHGFERIREANAFREKVPLTQYEDYLDYIERIASGEAHVLWPGRPAYFCKSSGTTAGVKYIPATGVQINAMIRAARNSLLLHAADSGSADYFDRKMIFLQGSPLLEPKGVIPSGRLSGIVYHHVPAYLHRNRLPGYENNCIVDWETKVAAIAHETLGQDLGLISGIPPWLIMYFEKLLELSGKSSIRNIFPNFNLLAYGGVNYEPYRLRMEQLIGSKISSVETYPASEGFIAYQDTEEHQGLLLNLDAGIYYEFIRAENAQDPMAERIPLSMVETGVQYALVLSTNAGLWSYVIGDTVRFVSLNPYRLLVTGRIKHFLSAFGEHVIAEEVEQAATAAIATCGGIISEFTVAPWVSSEKGASCHQWLIEFASAPESISGFVEALDNAMQRQNVYYRDLRAGNLLRLPEVKVMQSGSFHAYLKQNGKLGGQNKPPRLTNDRKLAEALLSLQKI